MRGIYTVARQTLAQCLRTRIGIAFLAMLAIALLAVPAVIGGPTVPLADRIRAFLAYSVGILAIGLGIITIFLAAHVMAADVQKKHIFMVAVKPLARWQYVVGRWSGIVVLDAMLLALAAGAIFAYAQHLRGGAAMDDLDRLAIEAEVFTARKKVGPDTAEMEAQVQREVDRKIKQAIEARLYDAMVEPFMPDAGNNKQAAEARFREEQARMIRQGYQTAPPGRSMTWTFRDIRLAGQQTRGQATVEEVFGADRPISYQGMDRPGLRLTLTEKLSKRLMLNDPVKVNGVPGIAGARVASSYIILFDREQFSRLSGLARDSTVEVTIDPVIQISYKLSPSQTPPDDESLYSLWAVQTPGRSVGAGQAFAQAVIPRSDRPYTRSTFAVSASLVDNEGTVDVMFMNTGNPRGFATNVSVPPEDLSILYKTGSFEANFLHGMARLLLQQMFLAALAVLAGTFLSFPVACMLVLAIIPFCFLRASIMRSLDFVESRQVVQPIYYVMNLVLPDIAGLSPTGSLVRGLAVPMNWEGIAPVVFTIAATVFAIALGCVILHKRELARVQV